jgi:diadenosine tetraphosphatase ApaH/serine/threonine PP2A family protein phosphatase
MKLFIISDIHSNLEALQRTLEYYHDYKGEKELICLGDIVGYGPDPVECLRIMLSLTDKICMGNHDFAVVDPAEETYMNRFARDGVRFSRQKLPRDLIERIAEFPYSILRGPVQFCHSTPVRPEMWDYIVAPIDAWKYMKMMKSEICFVGHSHVPGIYCEVEAPFRKGKFHLPPGAKVIINAGSVGQPRDYDPRLAFMIYDDVEKTVEPVRLHYDIDAVVRKIEEAGLPSVLGERLRYGN